jgi:hypothetical protein
MEDSRDLWVHVDVLVALDGDPLVTLVYLLVHPIPEGLADDAVSNIADIGPLKPQAFFGRQESVLDGCILEDKV